jgi:hypothetical protein
VLFRSVATVEEEGSMVLTAVPPMAKGALAACQFPTALTAGRALHSQTLEEAVEPRQ